MKKTQATRRYISSVPGQSIRFVTLEEAKEYEKEFSALIEKHQKLLANRYGEWSDQEDAYLSPAWVTQDRVPPREGFDQIRWDTEFWADAVGVWTDMHGNENMSGEALEVRCLREHLPPEPKKT